MTVIVGKFKIRRVGGVCTGFYTEAGKSGVEGDGVGWVEGWKGWMGEGLEGLDAWKVRRVGCVEG
jgi:hypothetical protein